MRTLRTIALCLFGTALLGSTAARAGDAPATTQAAATQPFHAWAATPPMGWNSYDAFGDSVTEAEVLANATYQRDHLLAHGWSYMVIDFRWYDPAPTGDDFQLNKTRTGATLPADASGQLLPASNRFPSATGDRGFAPLAERLHAMGLKFGIHVMRGIPRQAVKAATPIERSSFTAADAGDPADVCPWCPDMFGVRDNQAGQDWYDALFRQYAAWGVDYVKVDDLSGPYHAPEIEMIRRAIDRAGRPIVLSTSPGPTDPADTPHLQSHVNLWRISGDFWDDWAKLDRQFDLIDQWHAAAGPGHWPDADMIPFGHLALREKVSGADRRTRFTHDEQRTLMTLWSIAPSPLMLGGNLPDTDDWTLALITNDAVLAINQDSASVPGTRIARTGTTEVWTKALADGSLALGLFNRGDAPADVGIESAKLSGGSFRTVHDLWTGTDEALAPAALRRTLPPHGSAFLRLIK